MRYMYKIACSRAVNQPRMLTVVSNKCYDNVMLPFKYQSHQANGRQTG